LKGEGAKLTCWRDIPDPEGPVITQEIEYTDFPQDIKLYCQPNAYDGRPILMLPSEY
jgi:hypothetical protein